MNKPRIFVGSANESRSIVDEIESALREVAVIERWDADTFRPGHYTLEELTRMVEQVDFAIFVLGQDDITESRGMVVSSPRDNVIFEAGLFTAVLGKERTFYVVDKAGTKIPSDWAGLGYTTFDNDADRARDKVYDAVRQIRRQIETMRELKVNDPILSVVGHWWQFVVNQKDGAILSLMDISTSQLKNLTIRGTSWSADGKILARYRSLATRFDESDSTLYYYWEGEHPREETIPQFYGVGEIIFVKRVNDIAREAEGWFSWTRSSNVSDTITKSTIYVRAIDNEVVTMVSDAHDKRTKLINEKLNDRNRLNI